MLPEVVQRHMGSERLLEEDSTASAGGRKRAKGELVMHR